MTPRLLNTKAAAAYLSVSPWTLRQLFYRAELRGIRFSSKRLLFDVADLDAFVERRKVS